MTKETAKQFLPLVQALAEGKALQTQQCGKWIDCFEPAFFVKPDQYRIKPEPREFWLNVYPQTRNAFVHDNEAEARSARGNSAGETIKVREVLD